MVPTATRQIEDPETAQSSARFSKDVGKIITKAVPNKVGKPVSRVARLLARHLAELSGSICSSLHISSCMVPEKM